jgi:hypothetical protein
VGGSASSGSVAAGSTGGMPDMTGTKATPATGGTPKENDMGGPRQPGSGPLAGL